jgi:hypothetical protein
MQISRVVRSAVLAALAVCWIPLLAIAGEDPKIQIAILLDSSNSMDGLIEQTRQQIWNVVNALTTVRRNGKVPELEVALYHYGNDSLPQQEGFNRQLTNFTIELDAVSEKLFEIHTNGGQEYAGWVIQSAIKQLTWSSSQDDFRAIFIAGNEPFDQGQIAWQDSAKLAQNQDVLVNTIYCGNAESPERNLWASGAELAAGATFNINQDNPIVFVASPYDSDITRLNQALNDTYIPFGVEGDRGLERQLLQDSNAGEQIVTRGSAKSSSYYRNSSWDLVDALDEAVVNLADVTEDQLPSSLQGLSLEEKEAYIAGMQAQRESIQTEINALTARRESYINSLPQREDPRDTLDYVMIQALRQQLASKGFVLR